MAAEKKLWRVTMAVQETARGLGLVSYTHNVEASNARVATIAALRGLKWSVKSRADRLRWLQVVEVNRE